VTPYFFGGSFASLGAGSVGSVEIGAFSPALAGAAARTDATTARPARGT
jgi:hypothetical protein